MHLKYQRTKYILSCSIEHKQTTTTTQHKVIQIIWECSKHKSKKFQKEKKEVNTFFKQIFDRGFNKTKSDIEMFTDIYKVLERSLKII